MSGLSSSEGFSMDGVDIVFADEGDFLSVKSLLSAVRLPYEDIDEHLRHFLLAKKEGKLLGVAGLEVLGKFGLLRSLAVEPEYRGKGVGKFLCESMMVYAHQRGLRQLYALTLTAEELLKRLGFDKVDRNDVPVAVEATGEFMSICPVSAICMTRIIE
jgi:amino-acid N-acetyltransferase